MGSIPNGTCVIGCMSYGLDSTDSPMFECDKIIRITAQGKIPRKCESLLQVVCYGRCCCCCFLLAAVVLFFRGLLVLMLFVVFVVLAVRCSFAVGVVAERSLFCSYSCVFYAQLSTASKEGLLCDRTISSPHSSPQNPQCLTDFAVILAAVSQQSPCVWCIPYGA